MAINRLLNWKQQRFVEHLARGVPAYRAYPMSGYKPNRGNCFRLKENERVKQHLAELNARFARKTGVTVASLTEELDNIIALAKANKQPSAMVSAITLKARLHGLLIDRKETGQPGDFAALTTAEEIIARVRLEAGEDAAALIEGYIAKRTAVVR